ncbi:hypothetical protein GVAV_002845 [Gurleya vavrai]
MKFKVENYSLAEINEFPFTICKNIESSIKCIKKTKNGLLYTNDKTLELFHKKKTKNLLKMHNEISYFTASNDLILSGDYNGNIKLSDYKKCILSSFEEHQAKINDLKIIENNKFFSCSNDRTVKLFDFGNKKSLFSYKDHSDYVQTIEYIDNVIFSGGLDKKLISYDIRTKNKISDYDFQNEITKICCFEDNNLIIGSKSQIFLFDIRKINYIKSCYVSTKNINNIKINKNLIYVSSDDCNLKVYNKNFNMLSQYKFETKINTFDIYNNEIYCGLENGKIFKYESIKKTETPKDDSKPVERYYKDSVVNVKRIKNNYKNSCEIEKLINNNQHWLAFSNVLIEEDKNVIYAALSFIKLQNGISKVFLDRNINEIKDMLDFIIQNYDNIEFKHIFNSVLNVIIKKYEYFIMKDIEIQEKINFLHELYCKDIIFIKNATIYLSYVEACFLNIN